MSVLRLAALNGSLPANIDAIVILPPNSLPNPDLYRSHTNSIRNVLSESDNNLMHPPLILWVAASGEKDLQRHAAAHGCVVCPYRIEEILNSLPCADFVITHAG